LIWKIEFAPAAVKQLKKISPEHARRITKYLRENVSNDPYVHGKALKGNLREFWRYRIGSYRVLTHIKSNRLIVLIVQVGHRKKVYR
jgi:mRNA interferase RelE/StbE